MDTDQELLNAYRAHRNQDALARLVQRHGPMVLATCRRITGDHHDGEEAHQAVFLILVEKAHTLTGVVCLAAWLHRVARFVSLRLLAARRRQRRREQAMTPSHPEPTAPEPDEQQAAALQLDAELERLPGIYRVPLILHYIERCSCDEIASQLGISQQLVATRLSRGRERLRRRLRALAPKGVTAAFQDIAILPATPASAAPSAPASASAQEALPWLQAPSAAGQRLAKDCLRAMWMVPTLVSTISFALISLALLSLTWSLRAADSSGPEPSHALTAPESAPVPLQPRLSVPLCTDWEEALLNGLERIVSIHTKPVPASRLLESIGSQCGLTMVIDLPPGRTDLPAVALDEEHVALQVVLDHVARGSGTKYRIYAGCLLWIDQSASWDDFQAISGVRPRSPMISRTYFIKNLPAGVDLEGLLGDLEKNAGARFDSEDVGMMACGAHSLILTQSPRAQELIELRLRDHWHQSPPPSAPPARARAASATGAQDAFPAAERRLDQALEDPVGRELASTTLRTALAELQSASGVTIHLEDWADRPLRLRPIPVHLAHLQVRHALAILLDGTGLQAVMRLQPGPHPQDPALAGLLVGEHPARVFVTHLFRLSAAGVAAAGQQGAEVAMMDPDELSDLLQKFMGPEEWSEKAQVAASPDGHALSITQGLEESLDIQDILPAMIRFLRLLPSPPVKPIPAALVLNPPAAAPAESIERGHPL